MSAKQTVHFSYWSDPLCIWAFVAEPRLAELSGRYEGSLDVEHRIVPVFGSLPWRFARGPWAKDGPSGRADKTKGIAARFGRDDVSGAVWLDDPPASSWAPAMAIKAAFQLVGDELISKTDAVRYQRELRDSFFVSNLNVARRRVQLEIAETCGLPAEAIERRLDDGSAIARVWEDHREREALHIQGSPTYVFDGGRAMLYGNVAEGVIRATIDQLLAGQEPGRSRC